MKENKDDLIKAEVGDLHPTKPWIYVEFKPGEFDWRNISGKVGKEVHEKFYGAGSSPDDPAFSKPALKTPSRPTKSQIGSAKARSGKKGMTGDKLKAWAKTATEKDLLKLANGAGVNAGTRLTTYNELQDRGYDVSKINTSGGLDVLLNMTNTPTTTAVDPTVKTAPPVKAAIQPTTDTRKYRDEGKDDTEEMAAARAELNAILSDFDENQVTEQWYLDKNDTRVKKLFNLRTKAGRIKYDIFTDVKKRQEPNYQTPVQVVQRLNNQYLEFLENTDQRFMISAGGAGIGKTYGFKKMAEILNYQPFNGLEHSPGDSDYDYFEAPDVKSGKQLLEILHAHNGKVILFDDNDSILKRIDCSAVMKKATAGSDRRILEDPESKLKNFEFTGRIMVMSNLDMTELGQENEDARAVLSRAMMTSEIYLTVPETIEAIEHRYQEYEFPEASRLDDPNEDFEERKAIFDMISENRNNIDPSTFTVRSFARMINTKRMIERGNERRSVAQISDQIGSEEQDWRVEALAVITKSDTVDELGFNDDSGFEKAESVKAPDRVKEARFARANDDGVDYSIDYDEEDETDGGLIKAVSFYDSMDMDIEKAESLLFD